MREDVHARGGRPYKERLPRLVGAIYKVDSSLEKLFVNSLHSLAGERARVLAFLFTDFAEARIDRRIN